MGTFINDLGKTIQCKNKTPPPPIFQQSLAVIKFYWSQIWQAHSGTIHSL